MFTVVSPMAEIPPPAPELAALLPTVLFATVLPLIVNAPPLTRMPPPLLPFGARLSLMTLFLMVSVPPRCRC